MEKEANYERLILETAERLFLEKGFALTSTTEIAKVVGCNQALVHYYFRTKEKLFEAIYEKKISKLLGPFLQPDEVNAPFEERLTTLIEGHFDFLTDNPQLPFLLLNELLTNPARLNSLLDDLAEFPKTVLQKLNQELQVEMTKGTIRPMSVTDLLITIVSLNVTLFLIAPILKKAARVTNQDYQKLLQRRRQENVLIILRSLKP